MFRFWYRWFTPFFFISWYLYLWLFFERFSNAVTRKRWKITAANRLRTECVYLQRSVGFEKGHETKVIRNFHASRLPEHSRAYYILLTHQRASSRENQFSSLWPLWKLHNIKPRRNAVLPLDKTPMLKGKRQTDMGFLFPFKITWNGLFSCVSLIYEFVVSVRVYVLLKLCQVSFFHRFLLNVIIYSC